MPYKVVRNDEALSLRSLIILLFGEPGVYKTSTSFTADNPMLLAFDAKGLHRAIGRKDAAIFDSWIDCLDFVESGEIEKNQYKTLIIDTGGAMLDKYMTPHILRMNEKYGNGAGGLSLQGYGVMKSTAESFFNKMDEKKVDLIFICHADTEKEFDNLIRVPQMTGGARGILIQNADLIGYVEMRNNKGTIEFSPTQRHAGKNCAQFPILEIPHFEKDAEKFKTFMADIIKHTKQHINKQTEAQRVALKLMEEIRTKITGADSTDVLDKILAEVETFSPGYKAQVNTLYAKKYAELWTTANFTENVKTPDDFVLLSDQIKNLPAIVTPEIHEPYRNLLQRAGIIWNKESKKFLYKKDQTAATIPAATTPAVVESKAAEQSDNSGKVSTNSVAPTELKEKEKKVSVKSDKAKVKADEKPKEEEKPQGDEAIDIDIRSEQWFIDRIGKKILRKSKEGKSEEVHINDHNRAVHMNGVMQYHQHFRFFELDTITTETESEPALSTADSEATN